MLLKVGTTKLAAGAALRSVGLAEEVGRRQSRDLHPDTAAVDRHSADAPSGLIGSPTSARQQIEQSRVISMRGWSSRISRIRCARKFQLSDKLTFSNDAIIPLVVAAPNAQIADLQTIPPTRRTSTDLASSSPASRAMRDPMINCVSVGRSAHHSPTAHCDEQEQSQQPTSPQPQPATARILHANGIPGR